MRYELTGSVTVTARSMLHDVHARTDELTGWLEAVVDGAGLDLVEAHLELPSDALTADNPLTTREITRWLDTRRHPLVHASVAAVSGPLGRRHPVRGELTLRGVCRPLDGVATVRAAPGGPSRVDGARRVGGAVSPGTLTVDGAVSLDMRRFGLRPPSMLGLRVRPEVDVRLRVEARPVECTGDHPQ